MSYSSSTSTTILAPLKEVWDALTVPEQVKEYFFGTNLITTWEVGSSIVFQGEYNGKPYQDKGKVIEYFPMHTLSFSYMSGFSGLEDQPENYQILRYDLIKNDDKITVTIKQSNSPTQVQADDSAKNWAVVLEGLKKFVEKQT